MNDVQTDFLFATPSLMQGVGANWNLAGGYFEYNQHRTTAEADASAILRDWQVIGQDLKRVVSQACEENVAETH